MNYCNDLFNRSRLQTNTVKVGSLSIGGDNPIVVQSMTTTDTLDTLASVEQSIRMIETGCELVRLTAPSKKEAENLSAIKEELLRRGYTTPLVADIHFTPNAAEVAAKIVEKVRINPGNFADKKRFEEIEYNDETYAVELRRIEEKFTPLIQLCKKHKTAMRIGTNHGSLSDRILSRFGDTPRGMVESALEFVRICEKHGFYDIVLSMKASNTRVMVQAYRYLVHEMSAVGRIYPLHLGVTEAGEGEDGRIKSAVGIGALLEDGIGDTIRVSLTEEPEAEIPVARVLLEKFKIPETQVQKTRNIHYNPFEYNRRKTNAVKNIGGEHHHIVMGAIDHYKTINPANFFSLGYRYSPELDKWHVTEQACDFVFVGDQIVPFEIPESITLVQSYNLWRSETRSNALPLITKENLDQIANNEAFLYELKQIDELANLKKHKTAIILFEGSVQEQRLLRTSMDESGLDLPVILKYSVSADDPEKTRLWASSQLGCSLLDGFGDGVYISGSLSNEFKTSLAFGILQATRCRISKTEYISCPSCGRTLFDLQETTARIRKETEHLKGVKIGIMGCIVNGPGEMADADFGYVGSGPGKIHLYREHEVVKKNVPTDEAVNELIQLIKDHGMWQEKPLASD